MSMDTPETVMRKFLLLMSIGTCSCSPPARVDEAPNSRLSPHTQDARARLDESIQEVETTPQTDSEPLIEASTQQSTRTARLAWGGLRVSLRGAPLNTAKHALIFLHGYGMSPRTLDRAEPLAEMLEETSLVLPEAPYALGQDKFSWFEFDGTGFEKSAAQVRELLADFESRYPNTPYILGGVSQGAIVSVNLLANSSENLEALLLLSPNNSILYEPTEKDRRVPIFLSHGRNDPVLPFAQSEKLRMQLEAWQYPVTWVPFNGGHTAPPPVVLAAAQFIQRTTAAAPRDEPNF